MREDVEKRAEKAIGTSVIITAAAYNEKCWNLGNLKSDVVS